MEVKQISIFLENRAGRLEEVTEILEKHGINIRALSLADSSDFGILRMIVNKPEEAIYALKKGGFTVSETKVIAVEVEDRPGGLSKILKVFSTAGINVEYMYAFVERKLTNAVLIFRVEAIDKAIKVLQDQNFPLLSSEEVYKL